MSLNTAVAIGTGATILGLRALWGWIKERRTGYAVVGQGRDELVYRERVPSGERVTLVLERDIGGFFGPQLVYLPSVGAWPSRVPGWAADRRDDIVELISTRLGQARVRFLEVE